MFYSQTFPLCEGEQIMPNVTFNQCNSAPWVLVFEDHFNSDGLDLTKWKLPYQGVIRDTLFESAKQWLANTGTTPSIPIDQNIQVNNGTLKIITRKENPQIEGTFVVDWDTEPPKTKTSFFKYSSGEINTKWNFPYGKIEARIKIPKGKGFWPAFWTFAGYPWNELDIFEFWNENDIFHHYDPSKLSKVHHMTSHYDYDGDGNESLCGTRYTGFDFSQDFHIFTLIWQPNTITWYVDGMLKRADYRYYTILIQPAGCIIHAYTPYIKNKIYPVDPMSIILGLGIQHRNNNEPDETTPFPSQVEIDWVRYYQRNACTNINITNASQFPLYDNLFNVMIGINVEINCNYNIQSNQYLKILSKQDIKLKPGFHSKHGSEFHAIIRSSICNEMLTANSIDHPITYEVDNNGYFKRGNQLANLTRNLNDNLTVFPNPCNGAFLINFGERNHNHYNVEILNSYGIIVKVFNKITSSILNVNMTDFTKGLYFVRLNNTETYEVSYYKIILQ